MGVFVGSSVNEIPQSRFNQRARDLSPAINITAHQCDRKIRRINHKITHRKDDLQSAKVSSESRSQSMLTVAKERKQELQRSSQTKIK